ncbi:unnamed protein product, partial [Laminaria digitata]
GDNVGKDNVGNDSVGNDNVGSGSFGNNSVGNDNFRSDNVANDSVGNESVEKDSVGSDNVGNDNVGNDGGGYSDDDVEIIPAPQNRLQWAASPSDMASARSTRNRQKNRREHNGSVKRGSRGGRASRSDSPGRG